MASKAQAGYAQQIVKYFDRHPDAGIEIDVDEVLGDMDTWAARHQAHKAGRPWLADADRAAVLAQLRPVAEGVAAARRAYDRASGASLTAVQAGGLHAPALTATAKDLGAVLGRERRTAAAALRQVIDRHPDCEVEIRDIATRIGLS